MCIERVNISAGLAVAITQLLFQLPFIFVVTRNILYFCRSNIFFGFNQIQSFRSILKFICSHLCFAFVYVCEFVLKMCGYFFFVLVCLFVLVFVLNILLNVVHFRKMYFFGWLYFSWNEFKHMISLELQLSETFLTAKSS